MKFILFVVPSLFYRADDLLSYIQAVKGSSPYFKLIELNEDIVNDNDES